MRFSRLVLVTCNSSLNWMNKSAVFAIYYNILNSKYNPINKITYLSVVRRSSKKKVIDKLLRQDTHCFKIKREELSYIFIAVLLSFLYQVHFCLIKNTNTATDEICNFIRDIRTVALISAL